MVPRGCKVIMKKKIVGIVLAFLIPLYALIVGCPIYRLTEEPCPGCGMTRAFIAAIKLDFGAAFRFHPLFPLFAIETGYVFLRENILKRYVLAPGIELAIGIFSMVILWIVWIFRRFTIYTI